MATALSISIVTYKTELSLVIDCLKKLDTSCQKALDKKEITVVNLFMVDNSVNNRIFNELKEQAKKIWFCGEVEFLQMETNLGYGKAHNRILEKLDSDFHIVMNPDVLIDEHAITEAVRYMQLNPDVGLLSPNAVNEYGNKLYLLKRYPSILTLFIRGFFPGTELNWFKKRSEFYEMRDIDQDKEFKGVSIASGCFMVFRIEDIKNKFKFSEQFFLYFEDFDLTWQFSFYTKIAYVPTVKIVHYGGDAAKKGIKHINLFVRSAITFYNRFGWKLI